MPIPIIQLIIALALFSCALDYMCDIDVLL